MKPTTFYHHQLAVMLFVGTLSGVALGAEDAKESTALTIYSTATPGSVPPEMYQPGMQQAVYGAQWRQQIPGYAIVKAANFSIGMQALLNVVGRVAVELGEEYDVEIVETHHRHKIDAPSGTALTIVAEIQKALNPSRERERADPVASPLVGGAGLVFGRQGTVGERPKGQIGVHAVRMGDIVGQHEIHFSGPGETITIRHTAQSRETFAAGALRAAAWVIGKPPGLYSMRDVLAGE